MANVYAVQNGNWNNGSTWSSGSVPTADDYVYLNGKTVTIDTTTASAYSKYSYQYSVYANAGTVTNSANDDLGVVQGGYLAFSSGNIGFVGNVIGLS